MIYFKHGQNKIAIPQLWSEITLKQWFEITAAGDDQVKIVMALTGFTEQAVNRLSGHSMRMLSESTKFMSKLFRSEDWIAPKVIKLGDLTIAPLVDIKEKEYGQKIVFHEAASQEIPFINNLLTVIEIYLQPLITKSHYDPEKTEEIKALLYKHITFCDAYTLGVYYIKQLNVILKTEETTLNTKPTPEQIAAGINDYSRFGIMNTIRALAGGDILKTDAVLRKSYNEVYLWLCMKQQDAKYDKSYETVMRNKHAKPSGK